MKKYIVKQTHTTPGKYYDDGQDRTQTLYFGGVVGISESWGSKNDAVVFDDEKSALEFARRHKADIEELGR